MNFDVYEAKETKRIIKEVLIRQNIWTLFFFF